MRNRAPVVFALLCRVLFLACLMLSAQAQDITWTAGSNTNLNWSNAANWSSGEPTLLNNALFPTPIPNPGSLVGPGAIQLATGEQAQSLTFNATGYSLNGGTLELASPGNVTVTTTAHTSTINSVLTGSGGLTKLGAGTLALGGANSFTGAARVLSGTLNITNGGSLGVASTLDSLQIGERSTAVVNVQAGGQLQVGSGSSSFLYVGSRGAGTGTGTVGTLNMSAISSFSANVGKFYVGVGEVSDSGTARGVVTLATNNTIIASTGLLVGDMMPSLDNSTAGAGVSQLNFGSGSNNVTTPLFIVGGSRSRGTSTIGAGGTLTLNNGAATTDLHIGRQNVGGTATASEGTLNLSAGTFIANLGEVIIGARIAGANTGAGVGMGTLTLGSSALNQVTANTLALGSLGNAAASANATQGTLNMAGGSFTVAGDVSMAFNNATAGALSRGLLNLTGGTLTVGGNITKSAKVDSTAVIIVNGGSLDMTGGTVTSSQLALRSGSISNVAGVTLDAHSATTGTGSTGDALIFGDVDVNFNVTLSGATGGHVHYEAGTTPGGATISGNLALGSVARSFNIENNTNASIDTHVSGVISGTGGLTKIGAGTLQLSNANTFSGVTTVNEGVINLNHTQALQNSTVTINTAGGVQFATGSTDFTFGSLAGGSSGALTLDNAASQPVNLTVGGNNATSAFSGVISGSGSLTKSGSGTLTLDGGSANTYAGLTTVNGGALLLNKSTGVDAITGDISLINGADLRFGANTDQLNDSLLVTINGDASTFNGTASNANVSTINETLGGITVIRGVVNAGAFSSQLTVTGASSFTGTNGVTNNTSTMFIGNSGSSFSTGSLSLTDMTGAGGTDSANSFTLFGNREDIQTAVQVGAGGIALNNSNLYINKGTNTNTLGARLILDGNITVSGSTPSSIIFNSGTIGQAEIELSSTAGTVTRVIDTNADLAISPDISNGAATLANLTKTGAAKLTLSGNNLYNGSTQVTAGTLSFAGSTNLGDASATNTLGLSAGATLQYTGAGVSDLTTSRALTLGSGITTIETNQSTGNLILAGDISGSGTGTFTKTGAGTLALTGTSLAGLNNRGLNLSAGTLSFTNGQGIAINLGSSSLHLANQTTLRLDAGSASNYDSITTSAVATVDSNATINLQVNGLSDMTANTTYNLLTAGAGSGFNTGGITWALSLSGSYKYQLNTTDTQVQLQTLAAITGDAYWRGDVDGSWSKVVIGPTNNTNWATDVTGATDREAGPGSANTVYFSAANATGPVTTTLDNDFTINDIVFLASATNTTIAQGTSGTLTFTPASATKGVQVQDNAGTVTISAPVRLGAAQTWEISGTGASLTVSGSIGGASSASLTKTGAGTLTLSGASTYTGRTLINAGTIAINGEDRLGANPTTLTADQLTFNGGTLQSTATFTMDDANRGISLGAGGGIFNTNASTTLTVGNVISGSGTLTKSTGTGTLSLAGANTYTGNTTVLNGTLRVANGGSIGIASATAGNLQIAENTTATMIVDAGGALKVGNGSSSTLLVGARTAEGVSSVATVGTLDMTAATNFTANVGLMIIGGSAVTSTATPATAPTARGILKLAINNTITASTEIFVGQMTPAVANQSVVSQLDFGSGINDVTTPRLTIGGRKSAAISTIAAGGVLNLANGAGTTALYIGRNNNSGTSTHASGSLDLTNGTLNGSLGIVVIGERSDLNGLGAGGGGAGSGTGTLTLGASNHAITATSLTLGNLLVAGSSTVTRGTLNMAGGTFSVSGNVGIGNNTSATNSALAEGVLNLSGGSFNVGGNVNIAIHTTSSTGTDLSKGTLNITGGTMTVNGNITTSNKATATAVLTLNGGTLDMTNGSIAVDTFNAQAGTLKDVAQIFDGTGTAAAALSKTTPGNMVMLGTNSYTGATTVNAGVLEVQGTTGTGAVTVKNTGTLAGAGIVQSNAGVLVESGGTLKAGNNLGNDIGTLTLQSSLTLNAGSTTVFQLSSATGNAADPSFSISPTLLNGTPGNHDHIDITGGLTLGTGSLFAISFLNYTPVYGDVFNLIDWTALGGATGNGFDPATGFDFTSALPGLGLEWRTDRFLSDGVIYLVPEPSRALLLMLGLMAGMLRRRRR